MIVALPPSIPMEVERRLNASSLEQNNIHIHTWNVDNLPQFQRHEDEYTSNLQAYILRFDHVLAAGRSYGLLGEERPELEIPALPKSIELDGEWGPSPEPWSDHEVMRASHIDRWHMKKHSSFESIAKTVCHEACKIDTPDEQRWDYPIKTLLFDNTLKTSFRATATKAGTLEETTRSITAGSNHLWTAGGDLLFSSLAEEKKACPDFRRLTAPKPDYYLAFPILESSSIATGILGSECSNYSLNNLVYLDDRGLVPCPIRRLSQTATDAQRTHENSNDGGMGPHRYPYSWDICGGEVGSEGSPFSQTAVQPARTLTKKHDVCFPWAVIELKHAYPPDRKAVYQIANDAAVSLAMFDNLARLGGRKVRPVWIPPVLGFTFEGPVASFWLARVLRDCDGVASYSIREVWKGDLRNLWNTIQLCNIIDRSFVWAITHLRPWITSQLDQWKVDSTEIENLALHRELDNGQVQLRALAGEQIQLRAEYAQLREEYVYIEAKKDEYEDEARHLQESYEHRIAELSEVYEDKLRQLKEDHEDLVFELKNDFEEEIGRLKSESQQLRAVLGKERRQVQSHVQTAYDTVRAHWFALAETEGSDEQSLADCSTGLVQATDVFDMPSWGSELEEFYYPNPWKAYLEPLAKALWDKINGYKEANDASQADLLRCQSSVKDFHDHYVAMSCQLIQLFARFYGHQSTVLDADEAARMHSLNGDIEWHRNFEMSAGNKHPLPMNEVIEKVEHMCHELERVHQENETLRSQSSSLNARLEQADARYERNCDLLDEAEVKLAQAQGENEVLQARIDELTARLIRSESPNTPKFPGDFVLLPHFRGTSPDNPIPID